MDFKGNKIATYKGKKALVSFKNTLDSTEAGVTTLQIDVKNKKSKIAAWGPNNDYPQTVLKAVRLNGSASSALRFLRKAHYGNGLVLKKDEVTEQGKKAPRVIDLAEHPDIKEFFKKAQIKRFFKETITDLEFWNIAFPEYILSNNFKTINRVKRQPAPWCRFELVNEQNGLVENVYISESFGKTTTIDLEGKFAAKVPLIDSYWSADEVREYCKTNNIYNFIRPVFYPLIDEAFYPASEWHSVINSGWLDVANSVPALKKALFQNQMTIKYLIEIDERYFEQLYLNNWASMKPEERIKIREDVVNSINEALVGNDKAGKTIQSMMFLGPDQKQHSAVKITAIEDKLKDGSYLPEAEAANSEILFAAGVDPSLIGAGIPGGKLGAGSGSDKREAFTILSALMKTNRETTLEIFDFIQQFNGWDPDITADFEHTVLTTLDANPTGSQTVSA